VESIGRYQIRELLGRGGMGAVYRAFDPQLGREVAIKVLKGRGRRSEDQRARFLREAEVLARLRHPHVVALHEVGELDGALYLVLDLVEGETLEARLRRMGPLDVSEALRITTQLARALVQVHERGALHRDLKPENVLLDGELRPLLTDFGLAFDFESEDRLSKTGNFMGTPGFASPEQARGDRGAVAAPTDVFGLGAILYACLTGRAPFAGATLLMVVAATQQGTPDLPSSDRPDVPRALDAICMRCLEKDPQDRYPSAAALLEALEAAPQLGGRRRAQTLTRLGLGLAGVLLLGALAFAARGLGAEPSPTPSQTPSTRRTPTPPRVLSWSLLEGQRQRWRLRTETRMTVEAPPDLATVKDILGSGRSTGDYRLTVLVLRSDPAELELELKIESFELAAHPERGPAQRLSSARLDQHPYEHLLGSPLRVRFHPKSGRVLSVVGVEEIAEKVSVATRGQATPPPGFQSAQDLQTILNRLLHVLPGDEGKRAWKVTESVDLSTLEVEEFQRSLSAFGARIVYDKLGLTKRCTATRGLPATLRWHAQDSLRDLSGQATFERGRITRSKVVDRADVSVELTLRDSQIQVRIDDLFQLEVREAE
jgi:predicted Ser/Thr protein kinase